MAGIGGNQWTLALAKQSAKGTINATPTYKLKATGGNIMPISDRIQLAETDASRQQGDTVVVGARVEGTPEHYLRPDDFGLIAYATLGANGDAGSSPNFTHTATPASSGPYFTLYKNVGAGALVDRYQDCRITTLTVNGAAGGVLTYAPTWYGLNTLFGTSDPTLTPVSQSPLVYPQVTVTRGGSSPGTVENFSLTINNNGEGLQGDGSIYPYDYVWGKLEVTGDMTLLFENDQDYRLFFAGATTGTGFSTTVASQSLTILAQVTSNLSVQFTMSGVAITSYDLAPDPGGSPYRAAVAFASLPQAAIANYLTITTKNTVATY